MPNYSLLFAHTLQDADASALGWHWDKVGDLGHHEYRRPDTGERVRFVTDGPNSLQNLRWNTPVYLGNGWRKRSDASMIMGSIDSGFFQWVEDPLMPPPRKRDRREEALSDVRRSLARLEKM